MCVDVVPSCSVPGLRKPNHGLQLEVVCDLRDVHLDVLLRVLRRVRVALEVCFDQVHQRLSMVAHVLEDVFLQIRVLLGKDLTDELVQHLDDNAGHLICKVRHLGVSVRHLDGDAGHLSGNVGHVPCEVVHLVVVVVHLMDDVVGYLHCEDGCHPDVGLLDGLAHLECKEGQPLMKDQHVDEEDCLSDVDMGQLALVGCQDADEHSVRRHLDGGRRHLGGGRSYEATLQGCVGMLTRRNNVWAV